MKLRTLLTSLILGVSLLSGARAQDAAAPASPADTELKALIEQITTKAREGHRSAEALAPEIAQFDVLATKYAAEPESASTMVLMKGMLYLQILNDTAKGREIMLEVKQKYPETEAGKAVDQLLARIDAALQKEQAKAALIGKAAPELHFTWSSAEGLKTLSSLKGQVVVLDFWATWCGPCIGSFPKIREHVAHFKGAPVKFIGVTSIQGFVANMGDRIDTEGHPEKEIELMPQFMKAKDMTWDVAISQEEVFNPDYAIEGIPYLAIIAPDGTVRHAGLHPGDPSADVVGKVEAILKEFNLPLPKAG